MNGMEDMATLPPSHLFTLPDLFLCTQILDGKSAFSICMQTEDGMNIIYMFIPMEDGMIVHKEALHGYIENKYLDGQLATEHNPI
jgi:hypothetical protein